MLGNLINAFIVTNRFVKGKNYDRPSKMLVMCGEVLK